MDLKQLLKWGAMFVAVLGLIQLIIGAWAIEAKYHGYTFRYLVGDSPKLAIAAGVFLLVVGVASVFAKFEEKMHLFAVSGFLIIAIILSISAMGLAIKDDNEFYRDFVKDVHKRLSAVAGISGFSAIVSIIVVGSALLLVRDAH